MVDTPVGKKCRDCSRNRTHLSVSSPGQAVRAFFGGFAVAIPAALVVGQLPIFILAFPYGALVGEVAWRSAGRSRSPAIQVAGGAAAMLGWMVPVLLGGPVGSAMLRPADVLMMTIGVAVAVTRIRFV